MKKGFFKKLGLVLTTAAIAVTSVVGLTACNNNETNIYSVKNPSNDQLKNGNYLTVATEAKFDPFEYVLPDGGYAGFDMHLIDVLAKEMGYDGVYIKDMEFDSVVGAVVMGNADVAIAAMTINEKRKESVDFANPYYEDSAQWIIVKNDDTVFTGKTKAELDKQLEGKKIGVAKGQTGSYYVMGGGDFGFEGVKNAEAKEYQDMPSAVQALKQGMVNCILSDNAAAEEFLKSNTDLKAIKVPLTVEAYGIACKKGNTELVNKINTALATIKESGKFNEIYNTYFGE